MKFFTTPKGLAFLVVLLDVMGFGLIIPIQPYLAQELGAPLKTVTLLGAVYSLMQFLWAPFWGALSDRHGRRPVLLGTLALTALGHLAFASSVSLVCLFFARALAGIGAANVAAAQAVMSDTSEANDRSRSMALVGAAFGLGFVFGPALGGLLSQLDHRAPALFAALLTTLNCLLVYIRLPETRRPDVATTHSLRGSVTSFFALPRRIRILIGTTFLTITAFALMEQSIALYIQSIWVDPGSPDKLREASRLNSVYLVMVGVSAVFVQGFLARRLLKSYREKMLIRCGLVAMATSFVLIPLLGATSSFALFLVSAATLALGSGLFNPAMTGLISRLSPDNEQGLVLALNQSAAALGRISGPTFAGALFAFYSALPFLLAGGIATAALIVVLPQAWPMSASEE